MDMQARIRQHFIASIETKQQATEVLTPAMAMAVRRTIEKIAPPVSGADSETSLSLFTALLASFDDSRRLRNGYIGTAEQI